MWQSYGSSRQWFLDGSRKKRAEAKALICCYRCCRRSLDGSVLVAIADQVARSNKQSIIMRKKKIGCCKGGRRSRCNTISIFILLGDDLDDMRLAEEMLDEGGGADIRKYSL